MIGIIHHLLVENKIYDIVYGNLNKMKKKAAADIMNLLKADKAQKLSEKFAGYKRN